MIAAYDIERADSESLWAEMSQMVDEHEAMNLDYIVADVLQLIIGKGTGKVVQDLMRNGICLSTQLAWPHMFGNGIRNLAYLSPIFYQSPLSLGTEMAIHMLENGTRWQESRKDKRRLVHLAIANFACHPAAINLKYRMHFASIQRYFCSFFSAVDFAPFFFAVSTFDHFGTSFGCNCFAVKWI